ERPGVRSGQRTIGRRRTERAQRGSDSQHPGSIRGEYDDGRDAGLELESFPVFEERGGHASHLRRLRRRCAGKRRVIEPEIPPASRPHLYLGRRCATLVVAGRAISVDERDEVGRVVSPEDGDERQSVDPVAGVVERKLVEGERLRDVEERETGRAVLRRAGTREEQADSDEGERDRPDPHVQWFTWWSSMKTVHPSEAA